MSVVVTGNAPFEEQQMYVDYLQNKYNRKLVSLNINIDGEYADLDYKFEHVPFERIRRITGYLVGTLDNWNNAKHAEEADRVKHGVSHFAHAEASGSDREGGSSSGCCDHAHKAAYHTPAF